MKTIKKNLSGIYKTKKGFLHVEKRDKVGARIMGSEYAYTFQLHIKQPKNVGWPLRNADTDKLRKYVETLEKVKISQIKKESAISTVKAPNNKKKVAKTEKKEVQFSETHCMKIAREYDKQFTLSESKNKLWGIIAKNAYKMLTKKYGDKMLSPRTLERYSKEGVPYSIILKG